MPQHRLAQAHGVAIAHVIDPALHAGSDPGQGYRISVPGGHQMSQVAPKIDALASLQASSLREDHKTQDGNAFCHRSRMRARMDGQAQSGQAFLYGSFPGPQGRCIGGKEQHVIDIPHIARTAQGALDEVVEGVEIDIGPELAGQVADGQATRAQRGKQIVTGEIDHVVDLAQHTATTLQDAVDKPEYIAIR